MTSLYDLLSLPENDCLGFTDIECLDDERRKQIALTATRILRFFFHEKMRFKAQGQNINTAIDRELREWAHKHLISRGMIDGRRLENFQRIMDVATGVAQYFYPLATHEIQVLVATTTSIMIYIDDELPDDPVHRRDVCNFTHQHWKNEPPASEWGMLLRNIVATNADFYGSHDPEVGALMGTHTSTFIDSCVTGDRFEHAAPFHLRHKQNHHHIGWTDCSIERYPLYFRRTNGIPMPYIIPIFRLSRNEEIPLHYWEAVIPDMIDAIILINDVISFPKEVLVSDPWVYMSLVTKARRQANRQSQFDRSPDGLWTFRDSFFETLELVHMAISSADRGFTTCIDNVGMNLEDKVQIESANKHWQAFIHGYVAYHFHLERYQMEKLFS